MESGSSTSVSRFLDVLEMQILPLTEEGVKHGSKVFGAAIMRKSDGALVVAETNNEVESPLWHGEMHALKRYYEMPAEARTPLKDCIMLATHEPCSLCLSAITWAGFDSFVYYFSYEDSRDSFGIPHDLRILKEVFGLEEGEYRRSNAFWTCHHLAELIEQLGPDEQAAAKAQSERIKERYAAASATYQASKGESHIPLS